MRRKRPVASPISSSAVSAIRTPGRPLISSSCRSSVASREGLFGEHRVEHRPDAELLRAVALQRHFGDAAFDHLKTNPAVPDVLRRNDRAAQVKAGRAVEIADAGGDRARDRPARPFSRDRVDRRLRSDRAGSHGRRSPKRRAARTSAWYPPSLPAGTPAASVRRIGAEGVCPDCGTSKRRSVCLGSKPGWLACWAFAGNEAIADKISARPGKANLPDRNAVAHPRGIPLLRSSPDAIRGIFENSLAT